MIFSMFHPGSGLGDQLFCYLAARITAQRLGVPFTMVGDFKGESFMEIYRGSKLAIPYLTEYPAGKIVIQNDFPLYEGKQWYDPEFNFIQDNTIVDGCRLQDERYWEGHNISEWIQSNKVEVPDNMCVINYRGGEFKAIPELYLGQLDYWKVAIDTMLAKHPHIKKFHIHTDDPVEAAKQITPLLWLKHRIIPSVTHDISVNWRSVRNAKYAIIANSAFGILPRLLRHKEGEATTIAPRYWARRNIKEWSTSQNYYKKFTYL